VAIGGFALTSVGPIQSPKLAACKSTASMTFIAMAPEYERSWPTMFAAMMRPCSIAAVSIAVIDRRPVAWSVTSATSPAA
jgi:hypothetical protein